MTPAERIGAHVRQLRQARGLNIRQLSVRMDWGESAVNRLEHGRAAPTLPTLISLARALDVRVSEIVGVLDEP